MNQTLQACRRQLQDIRATAAGLDADLGLLLRHEADGDPLVSAVATARLLVGLDDLREQLEQQRDALTEALGDLPDVEPLHQHDGTATARE